MTTRRKSSRAWIAWRTRASARPASAEVLVLVHGYLGTANSWVESGVLDRLIRRGYQHRGVFSFSPQGVLFQPLGTGPATKPVYTLNLPSQAPVVIQADWLAAQLREVQALGITIGSHSVHHVKLGTLSAAAVEAHQAQQLLRSLHDPPPRHGVDAPEEEQVLGHSALVGGDHVLEAGEFLHHLLEPEEGGGAGIGLVASHEVAPLSGAHGRGAGVGQQVDDDVPLVGVVVGGVGSAEPDVFPRRRGEDHRILRHQRDGPPEGRAFEIAQVMAVIALIILFVPRFRRNEGLLKWGCIFVFTAIWRGFAFSTFGNVSRNTPSESFASILS